MDSEAFSVERVSQALKDVGFYSEDDKDVGSRVSEMKRPFLSADGLEFYKNNFLQDAVRATVDILDTS